MPTEMNGQARVLEMLDFIVGTVHMRGFTLFMAPQKFATTEIARAEIAESGRKTVIRALAYLAESLEARNIYSAAILQQTRRSSMFSNGHKPSKLRFKAI